MGVHGAIAGRRADLVIIDDPVKSQADADSVSNRSFIWDRFRSDLTTRLRPGGKIVLIMTRWHQDDLGGQLLARAGSDWRVVKLPALAEDQDPMGRPPGAALWPEWEDRDALLRKRELMGERAWSALFQQEPYPSSARLFPMDRLALIEHQPTNGVTAMVRAWDLAATGANGRNDPDWTVGLKLAVQTDGRFVVLDVLRIQGTPRQVEDLIVNTARSDGTKVVVGIPEDPGQAGKSQMSYLTRQLAGFTVVGARETGSKATRAMPVASQIEAGNMTAVRADWNHAFMDELRDFPQGRKDDQVDALVRAFTTITALQRPTKTVSVPIFNR